MGILHEDTAHFWSYLAQFLEWKIFQTKVVEKLETHFMLNNFFFFFKCAIYETMWKNIVQQETHRWKYGTCTYHAGYLRLQNAHTRCIILIAFPLQQWLHERTSMLRDTYIACLVKHNHDLASNTL